MSGVRAIRGSAEVRLPPDPHPAPKRDEGDAADPRRPRKRKPFDSKTAEPEAHQLDVEA
jgi:hypothetical protein